MDDIWLKYIKIVIFQLITFNNYLQGVNADVFFTFFFLVGGGQRECLLCVKLWFFIYPCVFSGQLFFFFFGVWTTVGSYGWRRYHVRGERAQLSLWNLSSIARSSGMGWIFESNSLNKIMGLQELPVGKMNRTYPKKLTKKKSIPKKIKGRQSSRIRFAIITSFALLFPDPNKRWD